MQTSSHQAQFQNLHQLSITPDASELGQSASSPVTFTLPTAFSLVNLCEDL